MLTILVSAGRISFKEFLYAVQGWVLDEDEYEAMPGDDEKEQLAAKNAAAERLRSTSTDGTAIKVDASSRQFVTKSSIKKPQGYTQKPQLDISTFVGKANCTTSAGMLGWRWHDQGSHAVCSLAAP